MARDADAPDGELSEMADTAIVPPSSARTNDRTAGSEIMVDSDGDPGDEFKSGSPPEKRSGSQVRLVAAVGLAAVVALTALAGWLGFGAYQSDQDQHQRELVLQVGRQGALNLTTIDWEHADTDVQRILESATGTFYDDFSKRFQPFVDVVKKAKSKSVGTITEAGLESESGGEAQVLVAVRIDTSNLGATDQDPRHWRMRISVVTVGDELKISNVAFVS